jgi:hypothetical protein
MSASTADVTSLARIPSDGQIVCDGDTVWIAGATDGLARAGSDLAGAPDPTSHIHRYGLDGRELGEVTVAGQVGALAVSGGELWVSGFRRSCQADVLSVLAADGELLGEADLRAIDIAPWWTSPTPAPRLPVGVFAARTRDALETSLRTPRDVYGRFGDRWQTPPVSDRFSVEKVALDASRVPPQITITFRWAGESALFAVGCPVDPGDESNWAHTPEEFATSIVISLEEHLRAVGYGIANATRQPADGLVWLDWKQAQPS